METTFQQKSVDGIMRVFRAASVAEAPSAPVHRRAPVAQSMDGVVLVARGTASVTPSVQRLRAMNSYKKQAAPTVRPQTGSILEGMRVTLGGLSVAGTVSPRNSWPNVG